MLVAQGKKLVEAYRLAGYESEGNAAYVTASQLLRNPKVFRAISYFRNQYQKRYTADLDLLVSQLMKPLSRPTPISWHNFAVLTAVIAGARIITTSGAI